METTTPTARITDLGDEGSGGVSDPARARLLIGLTGSGKSSLIAEFLRKLCHKNTKPGCVRLINGRNSDYTEFKKFIKHVTFDDLAEKKKDGGRLLSDRVTILICEDLSFPSLKDQKILKEILCKTKRHQNLNVFVVVHTVASNQMSYLHAHFDDVYFTAGLSNANNWKHFSRVHCPDLMENDGVKQFFSKGNGDMRYIHYDAGLRQLSFFRDDYTHVTPQTDNTISAQDFVSKYLQCQDRQAGILLFDYLVRVIGSTRFLTGSTYEIHAVREDTGRLEKCSVLDVLSVASTNGAEATPLEKAIFEALAKLKSIPRSLVKNTRLHPCLARDTRSDPFVEKKRKKKRERDREFSRSHGSTQKNKI